MRFVASRPKLQDVADLAGVSIGTASQALNNKTSVLPETRERVFEAAKQLGYELPVRTSSQTDKGISTVGVLVKVHMGQDVPIDPFYGAVLSGAEHECKRRNLSLMYSSLQVDELSNGIEWPPLVNDQQPDGWLILGAFVQDTIFELEQRLAPPIVLVDAYANDTVYDVIATDNVGGAYNAVTYLIEQGHEHIGLIGSMANAYPSIQQRREGYFRALKEHGIRQSYVEDSPLHGDVAFEMTQKLLKRAPEITAIFACNDDIAMAVMRAAHDMGLRIPDDLSVIGFDDTEPASEIIPALTTIYVDKLLMGALGVRQLLERQQNPDRVPLTIVLGTRLIERKSVQKLAQRVRKKAI
jgi:DNA-binding LacI/PurR family transcriptional regulator